MLSEEYIISLLDQWAKTKYGREIIKKTYGIDYGDGRGVDQQLYASRMKSILYKHVSAVIKSIEPDDIIIGALEKKEDGTSSITISFRPGSLHRESLRPDLYPEGLDNIVLLFAHGYDAQWPIKGVWKNSYSYPKVIQSVQSRQPNDFLYNAVNEFNSFAKGKATAYLQEPYK